MSFRVSWIWESAVVKSENSIGFADFAKLEANKYCGNQIPIWLLSGSAESLVTLVMCSIQHGGINTSSLADIIPILSFLSNSHRNSLALSIYDRLLVSGTQLHELIHSNLCLHCAESWECWSWSLTKSNSFYLDIVIIDKLHWDYIVRWTKKNPKHLAT